MKELFDKDPKLLDLVTLSLQTLSMDSTVFESPELFEWFFRYIIFNKTS
jgi:hypothetical protein